MGKDSEWEGDGQINIYKKEQGNGSDVTGALDNEVRRAW